MIHISSDGSVDVLINKINGKITESHCFGDTVKEAMESAGVYIDSELKAGLA